MAHILTKLHKFLISRFFPFVHRPTDRHTDRGMDTTKSNILLHHSAGVHSNNTLKQK